MREEHKDGETMQEKQYTKISKSVILIPLTLLTKLWYGKLHNTYFVKFW